MSRNMEIATLDKAAQDWAGQYLLPDVYSKKNEGVAIGGREWVLQNFYNIHYKDEFVYLLDAVRGHMGPATLVDFNQEAETRFTPRDDQVFADLLAEKLAITPDGDHIPGRIGTVVVGQTMVGRRVTRHGMKDARWPLYAGETEERELGNVRSVGEDGLGADPLPPKDAMWPGEDIHMGTPTMLMALNTNVSAAFAIAGLDPALDLLDEGTADGMIQGVSGSQPVDPDAALTGTVLFDLDLGTPAFNGATDQAPDAQAAATAIADDVSANATNTLTHCRGSSSNSFPTPLNDHIDGSAGTATVDFVFNTDAIVSGATVSMTAWTVTLPQGPTAT